MGWDETSDTRDWIIITLRVSEYTWGVPEIRGKVP